MGFAHTQKMNRRSFLQLPWLTPLFGRAESPASKPLRLGIVTDLHHADRPMSVNRYYRATLEKLNKAIHWFNKAKLDAVLSLGDFIDQGFEHFAPLLQVYQRLEVPHWMVPGNHDYSVADDKKDQVLQLLGLPDGQASLSFGLWRILLLDGTEVSLYHPGHEDEAKRWLARLVEAKRPNATDWNAGMSSTRLEWLDRELQKADDRGERVLIGCHFPVWPAENPHNLWNDGEVVEIIARHPCVAAWFNGHNHAGAYATRNHCHYINFKGLVESRDHGAFAVASLYSDRIEIQGFDTEVSRLCRIE